MSALESSVPALLQTIQDNLLAKATAFRDSHIFEVSDYDSFKQVVSEQGWAYAWWSDDSDNEARIKEETKATLRVYASDPNPREGVCFYSGRKTNKKAYFARSY